MWPRPGWITLMWPQVFFPADFSTYGGQFPATDYSHLATTTEAQLTLQASLWDNSSSVMGVGEPSPRRVVPPLARWSWSHKKAGGASRREPASTLLHVSAPAPVLASLNNALCPTSWNKPFIHPCPYQILGMSFPSSREHRTTFGLQVNTWCLANRRSCEMKFSLGKSPLYQRILPGWLIRNLGRSGVVMLRIQSQYYLGLRLVLFISIHCPPLYLI